MPAVLHPQIDLVLFDLGGVLIDPGGVGPMQEMSGIPDEEELWRRWLTCRWVRAFEQGACSADAFASGLVEDWGLALTPETFLADFAGWPHPLLPGAPALVSETRAARPIGCLTNTNALQWEANCSQWPLLADLDYRFVSFELGMVKPDAEIFDAVAAGVPFPREWVLFLDDNAINVQAAREMGFLAQRARGVDEARRVLVSAGILER
jgi:putative hydrolase of the HAD superfamily